MTTAIAEPQIESASATPADLVAAIQRRRKDNRILVASRYVETVQSCFGDSVCAAKWAGVGTADQWAMALKEARGKLVYRDSDMRVRGGWRPGENGQQETFGRIKQASSKKKLPAKTLMYFECVLTSTKRDRDGDVLESKGGELDVQMPVLWQHVPLSPIGRYVDTISRDDRRIVTGNAIADTQLGLDACTLIEFEALRISHGFKPLEFKPLRKQTTDVDFEPGFHILRFQVMETSVVSVPSNSDAVITLFSRDKLHHPLVKSWAEGIYRQRPAMVRGGYVNLVELAAVLHKAAQAAGTGTDNDSSTELYPVISGSNVPDNGTSNIPENVVAMIAKDLSTHPDKTPGYGQAFVHQADKSVHYATASGDGPQVGVEAKRRFGEVQNVKSVAVKAEEMPAMGAGWRQVHPEMKDHKDAGGGGGGGGGGAAAPAANGAGSALLDDATSGGQNITPPVFCGKPGCGKHAKKGEKYCEEHLADKAGPLRWNKSFSEAFDVSNAPLEPASLEYDWLSRYLACEIKNLYEASTSVPAARVGTFLTGLQNLLAEHKLVDVRHITYGGNEAPPVREAIQLNSERRDMFLVGGTAFYRGKQTPFAVKYRPSYFGEEITVYVPEKAAQFATTLLDQAWEWAKANNFLKGEAFALSGEFLPRTDEAWDDVFLESYNKNTLKRLVERLNSKGKNCPNRGAIFTGPPGTGKTLSGRILRNTADATFIWLSSRDFHYAGSFGGISFGFELAKELAPSILFMEDIDNWLYETTIDYLKTEMDGIARSKGVITILTTNFPERLPEALIDRPGRFHDILHFAPPTKDARTAMLARWLPELNDSQRAQAVNATDGYSGAHIYELAQFAKSLQEQDDLSAGDALKEALKKIAEQRDLITNVQLQGSHYRPRKEFGGCGCKGNIIGSVSGSVSGAVNLRIKADDCVSEKIRKLIGEGKTQDQAVAIALSMCGESDKDKANRVAAALLAEQQRSTTVLLLKSTSDYPMPTLDGSYEWIAERLESTAAGYLARYGMADADDDVDLLATYSDYAVVCRMESDAVDAYGEQYPPWEPYPDPDDLDATYYRLSWSMDDTGEPSWTGEPTPVELTTTLRATLSERLKAMCVQKAKANAAAIKAGRVISKEKEEHLENAHELISDTHDHPRTTDGHKSMCKEAMGHVKAVLEKVQGDGDGDGDGDNDGDKSAIVVLPAGATVTPISSTSTKAMSAENRGHVKAAMSLVMKMIGDNMLHKAGKAMLREAKGYLEKVYGNANPEVTGGENPGVTGGENPGANPSGKSAQAIAALAVGHLLRGDKIDAGILTMLRDAADTALTAAVEAEAEALLKA